MLDRFVTRAFVFAPLLGVLAMACRGSASSDPVSGAAPSGPGGASDPDGGNAPSTGGPTATDAGADGPTKAPPSLAAQMPQVEDHGGGVLAAPKVIVISFPGDPLAATYETFANEVAAPAFWKTATSEYGVGALTVLAPVHLQNGSPASLSDAQVHSTLEAALGNPANAFPAPDASTIYTLLIPYGVPETGPNGGTSCGFGGYHGAFTLASGTTIAYAVIAECMQDRAVTRTLAHELAEAATDPFLPNASAYSGVSPHDLGFVVGTTLGSEVGDMCETGAPFVMPSGLKAARVWSNAGASAGRNPCLPIPPDEAYFMALPALPITDVVSATRPLGAPVSGSGFSLAQGKSRVIDIGLMGDAGVAPWTVSAHEVTPASRVTFALDKTTGKAGDHLMLTVTASGDTTGGVPFAIDSVQGAVTRTWLGVISAD